MSAFISYPHISVRPSDVGSFNGILLFLITWKTIKSVDVS